MGEKPKGQLETNKSKKETGAKKTNLTDKENSSLQRFFVFSSLDFVLLPTGPSLLGGGFFLREKQTTLKSSNNETTKT